MIKIFISLFIYFIGTAACYAQAPENRSDMTHTIFATLKHPFAKEIQDIAPHNNPEINANTN